MAKSMMQALRRFHSQNFGKSATGIPHRGQIILHKDGTVACKTLYERKCGQHSEWTDGRNCYLRANDGNYWTLDEKRKERDEEVVTCSICGRSMSNRLQAHMNADHSRKKPS